MVQLESEMIRWGKLLFERRLISGWGGNLSCRLGEHKFLITGQHAPLGVFRGGAVGAHRSRRTSRGGRAKAFKRNTHASWNLRRNRCASDYSYASAYGAGILIDTRKLRADQL